MEAIVIGGRGMLGTELVRALEAGPLFDRVIVADLPEVDITREPSLSAFFDGRHPDVVFNCAAYTDVDACETKRELAFAVNAAAAGRLAGLAASLGAHFVHMSTDFIFDGRKGAPYVEEDPPAPLSVYGESKLEGERLVRKRGGKWAIARSAWLYGKNGRNLVDRVIALAREQGEVPGVTDQVGSPTWTRDLAAALIAIAKAGATGVYHTVNKGGCSRFEQIAFVLRCAGLSARVRPVDSGGFPRPASVPASAALSTAKFEREIGHPMRSWREALAEYIRLQFNSH